MFQVLHIFYCTGRLLLDYGFLENSPSQIALVRIQRHLSLTVVWSDYSLRTDMRAESRVSYL
jgi:hypothetical protein